MILFANYNQVKDENILNGAAGVQGTGVNLAGRALTTFKDNSTTRDIDVLMAGVRIAF
jgi:hypothetical protein